MSMLLLAESWLYWSILTFLEIMQLWTGAAAEYLLLLADDVLIVILSTSSISLSFEILSLIYCMKNVCT